MAKSMRAERPRVEIKMLTPKEIESGITKLRRRLDEVKTLKFQNIRHDDVKVANLEFDIREAIREVFGTASPEFLQYQYYKIEYGGVYIGMTESRHQRNFEIGIPRTVEMLEGLIARLEEKQGDLLKGNSILSGSLSETLVLHPRIAQACSKLYEDEHYSNAVFDGCVALITLVKEKSGRDDLDGADLMRTVFSAKNPILALNGLNNKTDQDEQEGTMYLFLGAVLAVRNPRAHAVQVDSAGRAREYIALLSLLANRVEEAKR
ncbi:MAG: TIGR02391 family protein [Candidatus Tectomicrobia bacterium]|nr:TIGR02391 family protein [Candidatus Tectomicrobia bacterium]